MVSILNLLED